MLPRVRFRHLPSKNVASPSCPALCASVYPKSFATPKAVTKRAARIVSSQAFTTSTRRTQPSDRERSALRHEAPQEASDSHELDPTVDADPSPSSLDATLHHAPLAHPPLRSLLPENKLHSSLPSFLKHARRTGLNPTTSSFLGTRYEYLAQDALQRLGFEILKTGKTGDRGVDLAGWWHLPSAQRVGVAAEAERLRVLVQCKRVKGTTRLTPAAVRELDGAFLGAPAGWRSDGVLGVIVSTRPATKGVITALGSSKRGLVWVCMEEHDVVEAGVDRPGLVSEGDADEVVGESHALGSENGVQGRIIQLLYNNAARQHGLEGLDVIKRHSANDAAIDDTIALIYRGLPVPDVSQDASDD